MDEFIGAMKEAGISCDYSQYVSFRHYLYNRYKKEDGFDLDLYKL